MLDKKISVSEQVDNLSTEAKLIYTWSIPHADDLGLLPYSYKTLKALVIPMWNITSDIFKKHIEDILKQGLYELFEYKGEKFYRLVNFYKHQTLKRDRKPNTYLNNINTWKDADNLGFRLEDNGFQLELFGNPSKGKLTEDKLTECTGKKSNKNLFDLKEYLKKMENSEMRHIQIISLYFKSKGFNFENYEQIASAIKRCVKPARQLIGYNNDRIIKAMKYCDKMRDRNGGKIKFTLETVCKVIDENFMKLNNPDL